jgi:hypothetical protein
LLVLYAANASPGIKAAAAVTADPFIAKLKNSLREVTDGLPFCWTSKGTLSAPAATTHPEDLLLPPQGTSDLSLSGDRELQTLSVRSQDDPPPQFERLFENALGRFPSIVRAFARLHPASH